MGGVVDQQLSKDLVLLDDLRGTLNHVMAWDHTQGGLDPGGGSGGANQDKGAVADPPPAGSSATAVDQLTTSKTSSLSEGSGGAATASGAREQQDKRSSGAPGEETSNAGEGDLMEHIPLSLGRRAESGRSGHQGDHRGTESTEDGKERSGSSRGNRLLATPHRTSGGGTVSTAARTISNDDSGSTTTSTTAVSNGSCSEWLRKQTRTALTPLTDCERMSLLQHVRPSVFGAPSSHDHQRRKAVVCPRPRSAAAAATAGGGGHASRHSRHDLRRATTARRRSREGELTGGSDAATRTHRADASGCDSRVGASRHGGVLVHGGWVAEECEPQPCFLSASTSTGAGQASPRGSRLRPEGAGGAGGCGGSTVNRQVSLVNSVAFGVNMGVLDALSDTTASAAAATAFASAAAGEATTMQKSVLTGTSTMRPWLSSENEARGSGQRKTEMAWGGRRR